MIKMSKPFQNQFVEPKIRENTDYPHVIRKQAFKSGVHCNLTKKEKVVIEISQGNLACKQIHEDK